MKKYSLSLVIIEIQIKTTMRNYNTTIRMASMYIHLDSTNAGEDKEKLNHSHIVGGYVKWYRHSGNILAVSLKAEHSTIGDLPISFLEKCPENLHSHKACTSIPRVALFVMAPNCEQLSCPLMGK
jgi:hypothetical protein